MSGSGFKTTKNEPPPTPHTTRPAGQKSNPATQNPASFLPPLFHIAGTTTAHIPPNPSPTFRPAINHNGIVVGVACGVVVLHAPA